MFRKRTTVPGLTELAGNLRVVFPPTVTIARLFALFQQRFGLCHLAAQFFRTGAEHHTAQFFYLRPQVFYLPFVFLDLFFSAGQRRAQEGLSLGNETELAVFPAKFFFQRGDTGEIVLTHDPFIMRPCFFYNIVSELRRGVLG